MTSSRSGAILLVLGFLGVLFGVPLAQIGLELSRREKVQFTEVFRRRPTEQNLRQYEKSLEERSWLTRALRPRMQSAQFTALGELGVKAMLGREGWIFFRPEVRYLVEPDRPEDDDSDYLEPGPKPTRRESALQEIIRFRDQLKQRNVELIVVPIPSKASVYPDRLSARERDRWLSFASPTLSLLKDLERAGVETIDLFVVYREARAKEPPKDETAPLYLAQDTHWTPAGMKLAARAVAERIRQRGWVPEAKWAYSTETVRVRRFGDLLEMAQIPGLRGRFTPETVVCEQVRDKIAGLMVPKPGGPDGTFANEHLVDRPEQSSILVLGDSYCRIYQLTEPPSLGELADGPELPETSSGHENQSVKRLIPGSAGFPSHLALELQSAVDYIASDGGAATDVRQKLSVNPGIFENKKVVVWEFTERDLALGAAGWRDVPLPADPNAP